MKKQYRFILLTLILLCEVPVASAQLPVTYQRKDSITICRLLEQSNRHTDVLTLACHFLEVPYVAHTLEVNDKEQLVVNTRELDCTTFVETVTALKICVQQGKRTWNDYIQTLCRLRYREGKLDGYPSRLHYFSDWIEDKAKMKLVHDIQSPNPPFSALQRIAVSYMSEHPKSYKALKTHPEFVPIIQQQEQELTGKKARYIPTANIKNSTQLRKCVKDGDIIAITCKKAGLDIAHLGFAVWRADGLHLLNASQIHRKVVMEPMTLRYYMTKHPTFTGIRIVRINNDEQTKY